MKKRIISCILAVSMLFSNVPAVHAEETITEGNSYFDFAASEYEVKENEGELKVKIVRHGGNDSEVDVAIKTADLIGDYGIDYEITDGLTSGAALVSGEKPKLSDFVYEDTSENGEQAEEGTENTTAAEVTAAEDAVVSDAAIAAAVESESLTEEDTSESVFDKEVKEDKGIINNVIDAVVEAVSPKDNKEETEASAAEEEAKESTDSAQAEASTENTETASEVSTEETTAAAPAPKKSKSTGSPLHDAANSYLNLPKDTEADAAANATIETLDDMYNYFLTAQGAQGIIHFDRGESEKEITVKIYDNDIAESDKIFMLALMGTDTNDTSIAANATTYVAILDDEEFETPTFDLAESEINLTQSNSEGYVTIKKTGGEKYFSIVYVSTVKQDADEASYESFEGKTVAFVPGETEKQVKVKATDFSKTAHFGVRLEGGKTANIGNHYTTVNIVSENGEPQETTQTEIVQLSAQSEDSEVSLMASNVILGTPTKRFTDDVKIDGGWKSMVEKSSNGGNWAKIENTTLRVRQCNKDKHSTMISNKKIDFTGIEKVRYAIWIYTDGGEDFTTYIETNNKQNHSGYNGAQDAIEGCLNYSVRELNTSTLKESLYLRVQTKPHTSDLNDPNVNIDWMEFVYPTYTFSLQDSGQRYKRKIYDFSEISNGNVPTVRDTYYDGESSVEYNPGKVKITSGSDTVSGFCADNTRSVVISAANAEKNEANGIYLKGIYLRNNNNNGKQVWYAANSTTHTVSLTPNQALLNKLLENNVIYKNNESLWVSRTIKVVPVFEQRSVIVNFENADRDDSDGSPSKGKFDDTYKCSYFVNVLEAYKKKTLTKCTAADWLDYYSMTVPQYSVIRVQTETAGDRTPKGVYWWTWSPTGPSGTAYYKKDDKKFSSYNSGGDTISETDYTKADIVVKQNTSMKPQTDAQTFYVGYSPLSYKSFCDTMRDDLVEAVDAAEASGDKEASEKAASNLNNWDTNGLKDVVVYAGDDDTYQKSEKDGSLQVPDPTIGHMYTVSVYPPDGYFASWTNMTGDTDNSGIISKAEENVARLRSNRDTSKAPTYVYGNKLNITLDTDDTRYYYKLNPKTDLGNITKTGTVKREITNLYNLVNKKKATGSEPVSGAYVDIAGYTGMTDIDGNYKIKFSLPTDSGVVSAMITTTTGSYDATAAIEKENTEFVIPALEKFTAKSLSASYSAGSATTGSMIAVKDDKLTISAAVYNANNITASNARFYVYDANGLQKIDCSNSSDYTTTTSSSNGALTANLTFNPKTDLATGDRIYVQFCNQNGEWYSPIDVGYGFYTLLDIESFSFSTIAAAVFGADEVGFVTDIMGDPLGGLNLGTISGLLSNENDINDSYSPTYVTEEDKDIFTWSQIDYKYGWSTDKFSSAEKGKEWNSDKEYKQKMKEWQKAVVDGSVGEAPKKSSYSTKGSFSWSITPKVGFRLTLSTNRPILSDDKSQRIGTDSKYYFEDLVFYARVEPDVSYEQTFALPVGVSATLGFNLDGDITGIYHMYNAYSDQYEQEGKTEYTAKFALFDKLNNGDNSFRHEGYIFINPEIGANLGVTVCGLFGVHGKCNFVFDMDFEFTQEKVMTYGQMDVDFDWGIKVLIFDVYSKSYKIANKKLFSSGGATEPIDFDIDDDIVSTLSLFAADYMSDDGNETAIQNDVSSRDYLKNRGAWNSGGSVRNGRLKALSLDASSGTTERVLQDGAPDDPRSDMIKINDNEMLLVFLDDVPSRSDVNSRALYYSIGDGENWSQPQIINDDGTLDDYPNVQDLGDKVIVSWSSADKVLEDNATVEDALKAMNIETVFFDKSTKSFGDVEILTKTTTEDYTADLMPRAAYDEKTDRLILYYTKTEYDDLEVLADFSDAYSVTAYLFYENGEWSNDGSYYTDDELEGMDDEYKEYYKENWYGQRFLDLRIDSTESDLLRVVETDAICYNGLALFTWTVDWDRNLNTADDRDVFLQIYNFDEESFTHIIKITNESGAYASPKLARSDNETYLFYGEKDKEEHDDDGNAKEYNSSIKCLEISSVIRDEQYVLNESGNTKYYTLLKTVPETEYEDGDGNIASSPASTELIYADKIVNTNNISDYDVYVDNGGQTYLFWSDTVDTAREIKAAMYGGTDSDESDAEEYTPAYWSEPFVLTNAGGNAYYRGIGAAVLDGKIYVCSGKGDNDDDSKSQIVLQTHTPYSKVAIDSISLDRELPCAGGVVEVTATVKNEGMLPYTEPVTVTFEMDGEVIGTSEILPDIAGGYTANASIYAELPDDISNTEFKAYINGGDKVSTKIETKSVLEVTDNSIDDYSGDYYEADHSAYTATASNTGNEDMENVVLTAYIGEDAIGTMEIETLEAGQSADVDITLDIPDTSYEITDGIGVAEVDIKTVKDGETTTLYSGTATKTFDAEAISLLDSVTNITFENGGNYTMKVDDSQYIQPTFKGVEDGSLNVLWQSSSDNNVAYIDYSNEIIANTAGTTTLTGIVTPAKETIKFNEAGVSEKVDWTDVIPADKIVTVTANVSVAENPNTEETTEVTEPTSSEATTAEATETTTEYITETTTVSAHRGGGGGGSSSRAAAAAATTEAQEAETEQSTDTSYTEDITQGSENSYFDDTLNHWAKDYVDDLAAKGILSGTANRIFEPDGAVTRAQFAQMLMKTGLVRYGSIDVPAFSDVAENAWYNEAVNWAVSSGVAKGMGDGTFAPNELITREQMAAMTNRFITLAGIKSDADAEVYFTDEDSISDWAKADVEALAKTGIITGRDTGEFDPLADMTRAESAVVIYKLLNLNLNNKEG